MRAPARLAAAVVVSLVCACSPATTEHSSSVAPVTGEAAHLAKAPHVSREDARRIGADELGQVPVLMYHRLAPRPRSVYERSPADFAAELERLADEHYVPVTAADFTTGHLDIPAGAHPVVLTFDDGDPSVFALTPQGDPVPGTAIAILLEVAAAHPGFTPVATLFVNEHPFADHDGGHVLRWLSEHRFEIGNHTRSHTNLRTASAATVNAAITEEDTAIRTAVPGRPPTTLALPYGASPRPKSLALHGPGYSYTGVFLVGANPAPSPYSAAFDPAAIARIRSQATGPDAQYGSTHWLDVLAAPTARRYTSDGDPTTVSYPRSREAPAAAFAGAARAY